MDPNLSIANIVEHGGNIIGQVVDVYGFMIMDLPDKYDFDPDNPSAIDLAYEVYLIEVDDDDMFARLMDNSYEIRSMIPVCDSRFAREFKRAAGDSLLLGFVARYAAYMIIRGEVCAYPHPQFRYCLGSIHKASILETEGGGLGLHIPEIELLFE